VRSDDAGAENDLVSGVMGAIAAALGMAFMMGWEILWAGRTAAVALSAARGRRLPLSEKRKPRRGEAGAFGRTSKGENSIVQEIFNSITQ
jgi:hypothetical protein